MTTIATSLRSDVTTVAHQPQAASGLAIVRVTIGAMFVWVFFENLGKGLYTPAGYAGLINYYIKSSHCSGCVEGGDGPGGKPRRDGGSHAGPDRDLSRYPARHRSAYPTGRDWWLFCFSAAFGFRSGAPRGSGNCWFRCSHRSGSLSDAPAGDGASTRGCRNGGHLLRGGDWAKFTCECPSSSLPIMKRRRLSAF